MKKLHPCLKKKDTARTDRVDSLHQRGEPVIINIIPQRRSSRASDLCRPLSVRIRYKMHGWIEGQRGIKSSLSLSFAGRRVYVYQSRPTPRRTLSRPLNSLYPCAGSQFRIDGRGQPHRGFSGIDWPFGSRITATQNRIASRCYRGPYRGIIVS